MYLIISKQHFPLLLWIESLFFSITHELDSKTPKGKLPVVLPDTACIPHHWATTATSGAYTDPQKGPVKACQMLYVNSWALGWSHG